MVYRVAYVALQNGSLMCGVLWTLVLFKAQYRLAGGISCAMRRVFPLADCHRAFVGADSGQFL